jgi:hypothetical protein
MDSWFPIPDFHLYAFYILSSLKKATNTRMNNLNEYTLKIMAV